MKSKQDSVYRISLAGEAGMTGRLRIEVDGCLIEAEVGATGMYRGEAEVLAKGTPAEVSGKALTLINLGDVQWDYQGVCDENPDNLDIYLSAPDGGVVTDPDKARAVVLDRLGDIEWTYRGILDETVEVTAVERAGKAREWDNSGLSL